MTYSFSGSAASRVDVLVMTNAEAADTYPGFEYMEGDEDTPVLVFHDAGNQLCYVVEGSAAQMEMMLERGVRQVALAVVQRDGEWR